MSKDQADCSLWPWWDFCERKEGPLTAAAIPAFTTLFKGRLQHTFSLLARIRSEHWLAEVPDCPCQWAAAKTEAPTLSGQIRWLMRVEAHALDQIVKRLDGDELPPPGDPRIFESFMDGPPLLRAYRHLHAESLQRVAELDPAEGAKSFWLAGQRYRADTLLWHLLDYHRACVDPVAWLAAGNRSSPEPVLWSAKGA